MLGSCGSLGRTGRGLQGKGHFGSSSCWVVFLSLRQNSVCFAIGCVTCAGLCTNMIGMVMKYGPRTVSIRSATAFEDPGPGGGTPALQIQKGKLHFMKDYGIRKILYCYYDQFRVVRYIQMNDFGFGKVLYGFLISG